MSTESTEGPLTAHEPLMKPTATKPKSTRPTIEDMPEYMTADEVAYLLRIRKQTLRHLWQQGRFPSPIAFNRRLHRFKRDDVAKAIQQAKDSASPATKPGQAPNHVT